MSDRNLAKRDDVHSDASPEGRAMATEEESSVVIKPFKAFTCVSALKEEEFHSEVDVLSTERGQYFSTPVQRERKRRSSTVTEPQENLLGYKSFFRLECDEIVHQLHSRAAQGWSASKRKLEELDISTIEAEPLPLLCCTPKSVWDETTLGVKRRKIDYRGDEANVSLHSCLTKHNSPGLGTSGVQGLGKVYGLNQCRNGDRNFIQEKSSPHFNSESHSKCSVFLKTSRATHRQSSMPAGSEKSVPAGLTSEACPPLLYYRTRNNMNFHRQSPTTSLEFRSFFTAECEKICNQLKRHDIENMMCGNVSSIEAEPPPVLSATVNSTIILEQASTCKENCTMGVSQLDLEKMNIDYSITKRALVLQEAPGTVTCNNDATGPTENVMVIDTAQGSVEIFEDMSLANTTQDIYNEESANGALEKIQIVHRQYPIANITQDITRMHDKMTEANTKQGIVKMHGNGSLAAPQVNVRMCEDLVKVYDKVSVANVTHVITMCDDASTVNGTQVIVAEGDGSAMNALQDNMTTYSKMPLSEHPAGTDSSDVLANDTQDIVALCNEAPAVHAMQNIRTACSDKSAADATQEVMSMFNEVCVADGTQEMMTTKTLFKVDMTVDIGTIFGTGIDPEDKHTNIVHAQMNKVSDNATLQNVTLIKCDANTVNNIQDIVSVNSEVTPDSGINKTFTHCKVTEPNVTHDISSVNGGTVTPNVQDLTRLVGYKDAPNILPDIGIIDEKPKIDATHTLMSIRNEVTANDSLQDRGDLTKVIATNCTLLEDPSKNVCGQPEKQSRQIWPMGTLAHFSPRSGNMFNVKDSTYLDLTDIAHEESMFNKPLSFITSTPLSSLGNHMFIEKSCELPVNSLMLSNEQENINKAILAQRAAMSAMSVTGQSLGGDPKTRRGISCGPQYPNISRSTIPKVRESMMPRPEYRIPAPRSTLALPVLKTPQVAKAAFTKKDQVALGRTNMRPPLAPASLTRKTMQYGQPCKSGTSSSILRQQASVNCIRTGKEVFKKIIDVSRFPASSLVRPPFGLSTPGCQIYAGKDERIPVPQSIANVRKISSVDPTSATGYDHSGTVLQGYTVIRPTNPVGSQISFRMKPRASGLPIRKQEAFLKPSTK